MCRHSRGECSRSWRFNGSGVRERRLCGNCGSSIARLLMLQWVRRPRTPVMNAVAWRWIFPRNASMGPASENAGYVVEFPIINHLVFASMGPASENAGYGLLTPAAFHRPDKLQWVRRPRTPVMGL